MPRFGRTHRRLPSPSRPHVVRLAVMLGLSLVAIIILRWQSQERWPDGDLSSTPESSGPVDEILTTTSVNGLPDGVFISGFAPAGNVDAPQNKSSDSDVSADGRALTIDPRLMNGVLDKTSRISPRAYYHLVDLTARTQPSHLREQAKSEQEITLAHLATEPDKYRGSLIFLEGRVRGLVKFEATKDSTLNPSGLSHLYQGDLFTPQGHPYPYVLIMPSVPDGFPMGMDLAENVTFAGYFLQLWRYQAPGRTDRVAPVLVGRMLTWTPTPRVDASSPVGTYLAIAMILVIGGVVVTAVILNRRSPWTFHMYGTSDKKDPADIKSDLAQLERSERESETKG